MEHAGNDEFVVVAVSLGVEGALEGVLFLRDDFSFLEFFSLDIDEIFNRLNRVHHLRLTTPNHRHRTLLRR